MEIFPSVNSMLVFSLYTNIQVVNVGLYKGDLLYQSHKGKKVLLKSLNFCTLTVNTSAGKERKKRETMEVVRMNKEQICNQKPQTHTQTPW